jgi:glycine dehydrogenase
MPQLFSTRHLGPNSDEKSQMLAALGLDSIDQLIEQTVPDSLPRAGEPNVGVTLSEEAALRYR